MDKNEKADVALMLIKARVMKDLTQRSECSNLYNIANELFDACKIVAERAGVTEEWVNSNF